MIHTIIVHDPSLFRLIVEQNETKKAPLTNLPYEMYLHGKIRIIGAYEASIEEVLASVVQELNPDTVFFLSKSYPVSDEKLSGDIILPNVFFSHDSSSDAIRFSVNSPFFASPPTRGETLTTSPLGGGSGRGTGREVNNSPGSPSPLFLEHYPIQWDYDFESFGLSVGGIHVSGDWDTESEDFRIRLRMAYENDTFDSVLYRFVEAAQKQGIQEKVYPIAYIGTEDGSATARNLWSIVQFIIGSIDSESLVSMDEEGEPKEEMDDEWSDGEE